MFRIKIRQQKRAGERWHLIADAPVDPTKLVRLADVEASESDQIAFQIFTPPESVPAIHILVGSVLVGSTLATDRVTLIDYDHNSEADDPPLICRGKLLADWVGLTELVVEIRAGDSASWTRVLLLPLAVSAGKLETAQFNQLFTELERDSSAVLLDIHGKTRIGLRGTQQLASSAPAAVLSRVRETVRELSDLLHQIARQPASRLRTQWTREHALVGQAISDSTLAEACRDPGMLGRRGTELIFREHLREHSRPDYRLPEHQVIADFTEYLKAQLGNLRHRIDLEIAEREGRKRWRNHAREPGQPTWWEAEDQPRIEELQRCRLEMTQLRAAIDHLSGLPFLPPGRCLSQKPQSTPLFRNNASYRRVFRVIAGHFLTYQATLDTHQLLTRARSLPVLYEWWCAVQVIRILSRSLTPLIHDPVAQPIISTHLAQDGWRFTVEFATDQAINFTDARGTRVRFRYQPVYAAKQGSAGPAVGVLDAGSVRTPDMTLEVYPARPSQTTVPELIIVLDAKYSSLTQWEKMTEVSTKYSKIGDLRTGRVLSRQVWTLTPAMPAGGAEQEGLRQFCTVDNQAFWSEEFDVSNPVNGAIATRPIAPGGFDPLGALIGSLLRLAGVELEVPETESGRSTEY